MSVNAARVATRLGRNPSARTMDIDSQVGYQPAWLQPDRWEGPIIAFESSDHRLVAQLRRGDITKTCVWASSLASVTCSPSPWSDAIPTQLSQVTAACPVFP